MSIPVDKAVRMDVHGVLYREKGIFVLSSGVHEFQVVFLPFHTDILCEC